MMTIEEADEEALDETGKVVANFRWESWKKAVFETTGDIIE